MGRWRDARANGWETSAVLAKGLQVWFLLHGRDTPCMDVLFTCYARVDQSAQLNVLAYEKACPTCGFHRFPGIPYGDSFGAPVSGADLFPNAKKFR